MLFLVAVSFRVPLIFLNLKPTAISHYSAPFDHPTEAHSWYYPHSRMRSRSTPITTVITGCAKDTRKKTRSHPCVNYVNGMVWNRTSRFMQSIAHKIAVIPSNTARSGGGESVFNGVDETYRLAVYKVWRPTKKCCTDCKECHHLLSCMSSVLDEIRLRRL